MNLFYQVFNSYRDKLELALNNPEVIKNIEELSISLELAWLNKKNVFICGNGGSAGNAIHLANDFNYGIDKNNGIGLRIEALSANPSVITCIANDEGYENIFSQQILVKGDNDDIFIVLSGSGNSPNVVKALEVAKSIGIKTFAILGFSGGRCLEIADYPIHFPIHDMQVSEDLQMVVGHICMQWLTKRNINSNFK
jgi:D-sedoheptulose 7-phosphate isomerase